MKSALYSEKAYSLLEVLIALVLSLALLAPAASLLGQIANFISRYLTLSSDYHSQIRLESILRQSVQDSDSHRLSIYARIHKWGQITFTDQSLNPVMFGTLKPSPDSDAISSMYLESQNRLRIIEQSFTGQYLQLKACLLAQPSFLYAEIRSFLALSAEGFAELKTESVSNSFKPGCYDLVLQTTKSILIPPCQECAQDNWSMLLPIRRIYSIYLDQDLELRYLSHVGESNIENQPLLLSTRLEKILITPQNLYGLSFFNFKLSYKNRSERELWLNNILAREGHYNLLANS